MSGWSELEVGIITVKQKLYKHRAQIKKWLDLLEEGIKKLAKMPRNRWEWEPFPIKERINTGLFIDKKQVPYVQKGDEEMGQENIWPLGRG